MRPRQQPSLPYPLPRGHTASAEASADAQPHHPQPIPEARNSLPALIPHSLINQPGTGSSRGDVSNPTDHANAALTRHNAHAGRRPFVSVVEPVFVMVGVAVEVMGVVTVGSRA